MLSAQKLNQELVRRYGSWLSILQYTYGVQRRYSRLAEEFCKSIGNRPLEQACDWDIREFLTRRFRRNRNYGAVYQELVTLRNFYEFLNLGGYATTIPLRTVRVPTHKRDPPIVASPGLVHRLIAAAKTPRELAAIEVLYATGVRVTELARMKAQDIDFESRTIRVDGKYCKARYVVFGTEAARAIKALLAGRSSGYLFRTEHPQKGSVYKKFGRDVWVGEVSVYTGISPPVRKRIVLGLGRRSDVSLAEAWLKFKRRIKRLRTTYPLTPRPMSTYAFRRILYRVALRAGIRRIPPKEFRHCCATHLLDGGADIREIQELLGHACLTTTQRYTHVARKRLLEVFDRCHPRGDEHHAEVASRSSEQG